MSPRSTGSDAPRRADIERARELQRRAALANGAGRAGDGARLIRQGLRLLRVTGDHDPSRCDPERCRLTARLLATLAKSTVETTGVAPALAVMDQSMSWSACLADPELTALLLGQRALILFRGGRLAEAEAAFGSSLALLPDAGPGRVRVLLNRGALYVESGAIGPARRDLGQAAEMARRLGDRQFEHIALHNLGCLESIAGDLPAALRLMQRSVELDDQTQQGLTRLDRARVLLAAGLTEEADTSLAEAAVHLRRDRCWQDLAEVDLTRAEVALMTDRAVAARQLAAQAERRFRRHGNDRWRRSAELVGLHAGLAAGRAPSRLLPPARRLAGELADAGFAQQSRTARLLAAEIALRLGRSDEASYLLVQAGPVRASDPIGIRLHTRLVRAEEHERRGHLADARRALARGLSDLAAFQAQFGGIDVQSAGAVHGSRLAQHDLRLAAASGRPGSVLAAVERSRAVSSRIRPVTPPADSQAADLLARLRRAVEAQSSGGGAATAGAERSRREIAELQAALRARAWLNSGSRAWHSPARLAELRAAAAEQDCDLVTIAEIGQLLVAVTVPADGRMRLTDLGGTASVRAWHRRLAADLDALANAGLPAAMSAAVTRSVRRGGAELGELLAAALPRGDRAVVLSAPADLLALPWALLPQLSRPLTITPTLSGWRRGVAALAAARPVAGGSSIAGCWSMAAVAGPGLAQAPAEAAAVADAWRPYATVNQLAATGSDLLDAMATCRLVHVAAHGVHRGENPMFSSLTLAAGPLFAYELDQRGRLPELVVLSACELARSTVRPGAEALGLSSVLLRLGTPCVVAGVAKVHDDLAAGAMRRYHAELVRGRTAAEALSLVVDATPEPLPFGCFGTAWRA